MARRLPRLEVIEAFIEAAHAPSFRTAAERCALSPAAFSRRIQAFRNYVGSDLFERHASGMRLTQAGRECLESLEPAYQSVRRATLELVAEARMRKVTISLSHSLTVGWMIPRLDRFRAKHPMIELCIKTLRTAEAVRSGDADVGVCAADIDARGLHAEPFLEIDVTPVASPQVAAEFAEGRAGLKDYPLFGITQRTDLWSWWSSETGARRRYTEALRFDVVHAMYEAAAAGLGIAAGMSPTLGPHLDSGRLVDLGLPSARCPVGYRLAVRPSRLRDPAIAALWSWLMDEARSQHARKQTSRLRASDPAPVAAV